MDVKDIQAEYLRLDKLLGIDTTHIPITVSKRAARRLGSCIIRRTRNGRGDTYRPVGFRFSSVIFGDEALFWDTIRHEYAHAAATIKDGKNHGHDTVWKKFCVEIGCRPERLNTIKSSAIDANMAEKVKYIVRCKTCGKEYKYFRMCRIIKQNASGWECGQCKSKTLYVEKVQ